MAKWRNGVIIGKFMPVHAGHQYLIETARQQVDQLSVLVCSLPNEPIPGPLRYEWVKELCPDVNVVHVTDVNPSYPNEHPDFWNIWKRTILNHAPKPDVIFTSEDYGDKLAETLACTHVCIDLSRSRFPISGTMIREDPYTNWRFLSPPVKAFYVKRVCVVGAESTGKTTLSRTLAQRLNTEWVPEYAVEYLKNGNADVTSVDVIEAIAHGQIQSEDAKARTANRILVCDTDLMTTVIYSHYFLKTCPDWIVRESYTRKYDLFLLTNIDVPWVGNKWRDAPHLRQEFHEWFRRELELRGRRTVLISGASEEARLRQALDAIDELFEGEWRPEA